MLTRLIPLFVFIFLFAGLFHKYVHPKWTEVHIFLLIYHENNQIRVCRLSSERRTLTLWGTCVCAIAILSSLSSCCLINSSKYFSYRMSTFDAITFTALFDDFSMVFLLYSISQSMCEGWVDAISKVKFFHFTQKLASVSIFPFHFTPCCFKNLDFSISFQN